MILGVVKELVGECKRSQEDTKVNATPVKTLALPGSASSTSPNEVSWSTMTLAEIKVGDIIKIDDLEQVPADCILLQVSGNKPECFVKTAALDGERNLKPKLANEMLSQHLDSIIGPKADQSKTNLSVACIEPTKELYYFEGRLKACLPDEPEFKMNLDLNQFLHRGSFVENSGHVIALVVYTGSESKLIMNLGKYVYKMSSFDKILNFIMIMHLCMAIIIALITGGVAVAFNNRTENWNYLWYDYDSSAGYIIAFFRVYLIVNSFVPLDLLAMLEISKLLFTPMMQNDVEMMISDPSIRDVVGFKANTLNLAEELG